MSIDVDSALRSAVAALRTEDDDTARSALGTVLLQQPDNVLALILGARTSRLAGELDDAELQLTRAAGLDGEHPQLVAESGYLALARANCVAAVKHFEHLSLLLPQDPGARFNLAQAYKRCGRSDAASAALRKALVLDAEAPWEVHAEIGDVMTTSRRDAEAREQFERALALRPGFPKALHGLGVVSTAYGDFDAAEDYFRSALRGAPDFAETYQCLADTKRFDSLDDPDIVAMRDLLANAGTRAYSAEKLHFALGKACDDCADYDAAFEHFRAANELKAARVTPWDETAFALRVTETIGVFDARVIDASEPRGSDEARPIVIMGMPRSGTTLVEQIFASHSGVEPGGEIGFFDDVCRTRLTPYPFAAAELDQERADELIREYREVLTGFAPDCRVTDTHPLNFCYLGLILRLFPQATVVHCSRDPLDTCLSAYFQDFPRGHAFANRLPDIAAYFTGYRKLMGHWQERFGDRILEMAYEDLVIDPPGQIQRLLEHAELDFEEGCLAPHARRGIVPTLSRWQVRQPIYDSSLERWRNYPGHLDELADTLGVELPD